MAYCLHPITFFFIQNTSTIFILAFTRPYHPLRTALLPFSLIYMFLLFPIYLKTLHSGVLASIVSGTTYANFLSYLDLALLSQWSFENGGPANIPEPTKSQQISSRNEIIGASKPKAKEHATSGSFVQRLKYGYFVNSAARLIGTPQQVKNVPAYSTSRPSYIPSRGQFLLRKLTIFCTCYLALDLATSSADPTSNAVLFHPSKIPFLARWRDVTSDEVAQKLVGSVAYWAMSYCTIQCYMGAWAFICVACGDDPKYWRPYFGRLSEGYTIRRFWG